MGREEWHGKTKRDLRTVRRCGSESVAGNGAEITGDPTRAKTDPNLQDFLCLNIH